MKGIISYFCLLSIMGFLLLFFWGVESKPSLNESAINLAIWQKNAENTFIGIGSPGKQDTTSFTIPLKRIGRLYLMEAVIDGVSGNLIFDTGATCLVLNRTYFRDHVSFGEHTPSGITGNIGQIEKVTADNVAIGKLKFKGVSSSLTDLGHIENKRGIKVLGLFGFDLIKKYEIIIDVANGELRLHPIDKKGGLLNLSQEFKSDIVQEIETSHNILFVKGALSKKLMLFCFDTGAETNALSIDLPRDVLQNVTITRTSKLWGSGSASTEVIFGQMNNFAYGDTILNNMETVITYLDHLNEGYGTHFDGVLGFDFISKGTFCINFVKKQMGISFLTSTLQ